MPKREETNTNIANLNSDFFVIVQSVVTTARLVTDSNILEHTV